jgi:hypothetical protein
MRARSRTLVDEAGRANLLGQDLVGRRVAGQAVVEELVDALVQTNLGQLAALRALDRVLVGRRHVAHGAGRVGQRIDHLVLGSRLLLVVVSAPQRNRRRELRELRRHGGGHDSAGGLKLVHLRALKAGRQRQVGGHGCRGHLAVGGRGRRERGRQQESHESHAERAHRSELEGTSHAARYACEHTATLPVKVPNWTNRCRMVTRWQSYYVTRIRERAGPCKLPRRLLLAAHARAVRDGPRLAEAKGVEAEVALGPAVTCRRLVDACAVATKLSRLQSTSSRPRAVLTRAAQSWRWTPAGAKALPRVILCACVNSMLTGDDRRGQA